MLISGLSSGLPYIKQKQVRLLAVSSAKRVALLPDVPTMAEALPGYDVSSWYAVLAPAGTPRAIIDRLHQASVAAVTTPEVQAKLATAGVDVETLTPQQLYAKLSADLERWGKVVKAAGMKQQ
jgi:tripartite-type tricarboxylate transporter receptor subunit TctC